MDVPTPPAPPPLPPGWQGMFEIPEFQRIKTNYVVEQVTLSRFTLKLRCAARIHQNLPKTDFNASSRRATYGVQFGQPGPSTLNFRLTKPEFAT